MHYSRNSPSPRYAELLDQYRRMHIDGETSRGAAPEIAFPGRSLLPQAVRIKSLIDRTGAQTILDYGCGKGLQYDLRNFELEGHGFVESVVDYWDVAGVHCYDPCYEQYNRLPEGKFDGVISTDVLEHCPEQDLEWILQEMFGYAQMFVFANVASYAARKHLPNGENAHCTIRPAGWWDALVRRIARGHPRVLWEVWVRSVAPAGGIRDERLGNFDPQA